MICIWLPHALFLARLSLSRSCSRSFVRSRSLSRNLVRSLSCSFVRSHSRGLFRSHSRSLVRSIHDIHFSTCIVTWIIESLNHIVPLLHVHTVASPSAVSQKSQLFGAAKAAADRKGTATWLVTGLWVIWDTQRACCAAFAI